MAQADSQTTTIRLSSLFRDPLVRSAFERAARPERDSGAAFAIVPPNPVTLAGGAAEPMEAEYA
jgi:hypothetical protein